MYEFFSERLFFMTIFDKIREKNKIIAFLVRLQNSAFYPIFFALICIISGTSSKEVYLPCIWFLTLTVIFGGLFSDDFKIFLVPALLIYYSIGFDVGPNLDIDLYTAAFTMPFDPSSLPHFAICIALLLAVILYRILQSGLLKEIMLKKGLFFWGIIAIDIALLLNGLFSVHWQPMNLIYGLLIGSGLTLFYCVFLVLLTRSKDTVSYACKTLVCAGWIVVAQIAIRVCQILLEGNQNVLHEGSHIILNRDLIRLAWGVPTIFGAVMALAIPAALYLARARRYPVLSLFSALAFLGAIFVINARSALLFGGIAFVIGIIICCFKNKNKIANRAFTLSLVGCGVIGLTAFLFIADNPTMIFEKLAATIRLDFLTTEEASLSGIFGDRAGIWLGGLKDFISAPIFGVGFSVGRDMSGIDVSVHANIFDIMYHNIIVEFLGSMGLVGIIAFLFHLKHGIELTFRKFDWNRILVLLIPTSILAMSLLDNFFFYPNFAIVYGIFLACAELMLEEKRQEKLDNINRVKKGQKPRVLFPYVEAGKGHIVPTHTVCEVFKKKYGDKVEVVESHFFTETGNADMQKTEKLFKKAVENQNRSPILSILCKIGNSLAGNAFALYVLLSLSISGRKTNPLAVKHIEELDANVIYATHWAIPYYVNQIKGPHPYTISFCPDVLANGAFDVDSNNFLISNSIGYKKALRYRMYAGGNITQVPFPIRPETESYRAEGKKSEIRKKLGIPDDEFVVTLCDGGYGMARLEKTVKHLLRIKAPMTVIALCGMNEELHKKLKNLRVPENMRLISVGFTDKVLEYICAADLFVGKSGANSMAEPAALGVPIIVTKCITYVERSIKNFYVHTLKGGIYIPCSRMAAKKIVFFSQNRAELNKYRQNLISNPIASYDAEATADLIWQRVLEVWDE
jgi:UDP-N-acetylglucosamine:LPS N-acetylglucosamine transferase